MVMETLIGVRCIIGGCGEAKARSAELFLEIFIRPQGIKNSVAVAEDFSIHSYQEIIFFDQANFNYTILHVTTQHICLSLRQSFLLNFGCYIHPFFQSLGFILSFSLILC